MNAHGSEPLRLTEEQESYPTTSLSPNGKQMAYATERIGGRWWSERLCRFQS